MTFRCVRQGNIHSPASDILSFFSLIWLSYCLLRYSVSSAPTMPQRSLLIDMSPKVGWTGPAPELSRKRPTADLVSRKVLTPLLGQIMICVLAQFTIYKIVKLQPWLVQTSSTLGYAVLLLSQVRTPSSGLREEQYRKLRKHCTILVFVFPICFDKCGPQCRATFSRANEFKRLVVTSIFVPDFR